MHLGTFSLLSNVAPFFSKLVVAPLLNVRVILFLRLSLQLGKMARPEPRQQSQRSRIFIVV